MILYELNMLGTNYSILQYICTTNICPCIIQKGIHMKIFVTAFKNTISRLKSRLTPFSLLLLCLLTILSLVVRLIIAGMSAMAATVFLVEYLCNLEILMWKTAFKERSILNIFVKYSDPKNHVYANLSTITMTFLALTIVLLATTHILLPITFSLILVAMVAVISIP